MGMLHVQGEDYLRLRLYVCIWGMVLVQKGNWSFHTAELVELSSVCAGRRPVVLAEAVKN